MVNLNVELPFQAKEWICWEGKAVWKEEIRTQTALYSNAGSGCCVFCDIEKFNLLLRLKVFFYKMNIIKIILDTCEDKI